MTEEDIQLVITRKADDGATEFLGFNRRTWVLEYPEAAQLAPKEARKLVEKLGNCRAVQNYGDNDESVAFGDDEENDDGGGA